MPHGDLFVGTGHFNPPTVPLDADGQGVPYATYGFAAQIAEVEVDVELGTVKLLHIHAAHDVGRAINPTQVEGQIHGGIAQGIGMALMEEYVNGQHRQPARLPDPDLRRRAADHGAPDRGPRAARPLGRQGRGRAGAGGHRAGDPERDPRTPPACACGQVPVTPSRLRAALLHPSARSVPSSRRKSGSIAARRASATSGSRLASG